MKTKKVDKDSVHQKNKKFFIAKSEKIKRLISIIGTAKDKNKIFDKHSVYEQ